MDGHMEEDQEDVVGSNTKCRVHLYNRWLPPAVAEKVVEEEHRFHELVIRLRETWQPGNSASALETVKFVHVIHSFLRAQSDVAIADLELAVKIGLEVILEDSISLYIQTRWANCLSRILGKYRSKLKLTIGWRPFYKVLLDAHFKRQQFYQGLGTSWDHLTALVTFVRNCRHFFPPGSATEIWNEFRPCFDDLCQNSCLEAIGFLSLFLPAKPQNTNSEAYVFTSEWVTECLQFWSAIPSCQFWSLQWTSLITRCIKNFDIKWEPFLPVLFTHYLNSFRVPVGRAGASPPVNWNVPHNVSLAFHQSPSSKFVANSIVYLLAPGGAAHLLFEKLVDLLEPYYHPSNGGSWTDSLERFLFYLVHYFLKRLEKERRSMLNLQGSPNEKHVLGPSERAAFVRTVLRLVERGQYSKTERLAKTCARILSQLSYIEPSLALPISITSFETAMNSITATHQLEFALQTLALSSRPILLSYETFSNEGFVLDAYLMDCRNTLVDAMFRTLPGLDANDPPKTLATMQFYCSVLSNVAISGNGDLKAPTFPIDWDQWTSEFLDYLFSLLRSLEPGGQSAGSLSIDADANDGFLMETDSYYFSLLGLFFGRLAPDLYKQVLVRVKRFVVGNVLPGAVDEVAALCYSVVESDPSLAIGQLLEPIMKNLISTLGEAPSTGFSNNEVAVSAVSKATLSPALERTATYQLRILATSLLGGGATLVSVKELLKSVITVAFNAPSSKVNDAARTFLRYVIGGLVCYYPMNSCRSSTLETVDRWIGTKEKDLPQTYAPSWHVPSIDEVMFVEELIEMHLQGPLAILKKIANEGYHLDYPGQEKDYLRVTLLRLEAVLYGLGSCIPDFHMVDSPSSYTVVGSFGVTIGGPSLRKEVAETLHKACGYLLKEKGDESVVLKLLISVMDATVNFGSVENSWWRQSRNGWEAERKNLTEPVVNFITSSVTKSRRPLWLVHQRLHVQTLCRSSEAEYYHYYVNSTEAALPPAVELVGKDLLKLSLHRYKSIRSYAGGALGVLLHRYPLLLRMSLPLLTRNLSDPNATEESALGACAMLRKGAIMRFLMEDWTCLASFLASILDSAHHDSSKAQSAINKVFVAFNWYFGGVPINFSRTFIDNMPTTYESMISHVKNFVSGDAASVHWRYNLMAHGLLLFLALCPVRQPEKESLESNRNICGHFLTNLTSELPALRPLSAIAVLLLLGAESDKMQDLKATETNGLTSSVQKLLDEGFGDSIIKNFAVDHHYSEGDGFNIPRTMSDVGLVSLMPTYKRDWPLTRTWDSKTRGVAFSTTFAKLFEELTRRYGQSVLDVLRQPLMDASSALEERGKQCTAAEIVAGFLHSDAPCVVVGWEEWLCSLLQKTLKTTTLESAPEWVACIRYAVGAEDRYGQKVPSLRHKILECLAELLPSSASSNLVTKRLNFLIVALLEVNPNNMLENEIVFQAALLKEVMGYKCHSGPQVRKAAGSLICILCANLRLSTSTSKEDSIDDIAENARRVLADCTKALVNGAASAAFKIQDVNEKSSNTGAPGDKQAVREMETVFHFLLTCIRSGRFNVLADVVVDLLHPLLVLQETSEKDLSNLAKSALRNMRWQLFPALSLKRAVSTILKAANEDNWRVRVAALSFVQPFIYRHSFILGGSDWQLLWDKVTELLCDPQLEVRELSATTAAGMMKGAEAHIVNAFRKQALTTALSICSPRKSKFQGFTNDGLSVPMVHGAVLRLASCVLSVPYDIPSWLPEMVTAVTYFSQFPWPIRATVTKAIGEFRRTHSDTWDIQKQHFSEEQLESLLNSGTASYFA